MTNYFTHILLYIEQVFNPAGGRELFVKRSKKSISPHTRNLLSPEGHNIRGCVVSNQEKFRKSPAP